MRADIHDGQEHKRSVQGPDTEAQDLSPPNHHFPLATRGRSIQKCHKRTHALHCRRGSTTTGKSARRRRQHIRRIQHRECDDASERRRYQRQLLHHLPGWANVQTTPGLSFGTSPVNAGTYLYADPTAVLKNAWAQDQQVQATVKVRGAFGSACCKEVELLIRMTIARNSITGYELNCSVVSAGPYLTLVRWIGPLNNFTYIVRNATTSCVNGDVLKLTAVGNTFTVYKNGVQVLQGTDATFQKGSPGVGFYNSVDTNWSGFGLSNFSASNVGSSDTTPPRIQDHD